MKKVGIVMGSDSDLPILRKAMDTLSSLEIPYEVHIYSAHRPNFNEAAEAFFLSQFIFSNIHSPCPLKLQ